MHPGRHPATDRRTACRTGRFGFSPPALVARVVVEAAQQLAVGVATVQIHAVAAAALRATLDDLRNRGSARRAPENDPPDSPGKSACLRRLALRLRNHARSGGEMGSGNVLAALCPSRLRRAPTSFCRGPSWSLTLRCSTSTPPFISGSVGPGPSGLPEEAVKIESVADFGQRMGGVCNPTLAWNSAALVRDRPRRPRRRQRRRRGVVQPGDGLHHRTMRPECPRCVVVSADPHAEPADLSVVGGQLFEPAQAVGSWPLMTTHDR